MCISSLLVFTGLMAMLMYISRSANDTVDVLAKCRVNRQVVMVMSYK